jgi:hypothetical protein
MRSLPTGDCLETAAGLPSSTCCVSALARRCRRCGSPATPSTTRVSAVLHALGVASRVQTLLEARRRRLVGDGFAQA